MGLVFRRGTGSEHFTDQGSLGLLPGLKSTHGLLRIYLDICLGNVGASRCLLREPAIPAQLFGILLYKEGRMSLSIREYTQLKRVNTVILKG
jgi:hypothetical protein